MQDVVRLVGRDAGGDIFEMKLEVPDPLPGDGPAPTQFLESIGRFYGMDSPPSLTGDQAHALLAYRDFGRACASVIFSKLYAKRAAFVARIFASFVSQRANMAADVVTWMDQRFEAGDDAAGTAALLPRMPHYPACQQFAVDLAADFAGRTDLFKQR